MRFSRLLLTLLLAGVGLAHGAPGLDLHRVAAEEGSTRLLNGNSVQLLDDGPQALAERLKLVANAQHHLLISTFIWRDDEVGREMVDAIRRRIAERRKEGVKLRVLIILDDTTPLASLDFGSRVRHRLEKSGALVRVLHPLMEGLQPFYVTRLHDKVMVVDGTVAILGGRNYSDHYFEEEGRKFWYDADVRLEGPAVEDLQMHWLKMWCVLGRLSRVDRFFSPPEKTLAGIRHFWKHGRYPDGSSPLTKFATRTWFPRQLRAGDQQVAVLYDNPMVWKRAPTIAVLQKLIQDASREVDVVTPFPNFPLEIIDAMEAAVQRGVRVRVVTNSERRALRGGLYWKVLLPAILRLAGSGVEFWGWEGLQKDEEDKVARCRPSEMPYSGIHAKYVQVDGKVGIVSASNFNLRSGYFNTEAGVMVEDPDFAGEIRDRVEGLIGVKPFELRCEGGTRLPLEKPSVYFDADRQRHFQRELGDSGRRLEAYGPIF